MGSFGHKFGAKKLNVLWKKFVIVGSFAHEALTEHWYEVYQFFALWKYSSSPEKAPDDAAKVFNCQFLIILAQYWHLQRPFDVIFKCRGGLGFG